MRAGLDPCLSNFVLHSSLFFGPGPSRPCQVLSIQFPLKSIGVAVSQDFAGDAQPLVGSWAFLFRGKKKNLKCGGCSNTMVMGMDSETHYSGGSWPEQVCVCGFLPTPSACGPVPVPPLPPRPHPCSTHDPTPFHPPLWTRNPFAPFSPPNCSPKTREAFPPPPTPGV